jgi:hypothetical protein
VLPYIKYTNLLIYIDAVVSALQPFNQWRLVEGAIGGVARFNGWNGINGTEHVVSIGLPCDTCPFIPFQPNELFLPPTSTVFKCPQWLRPFPLW